MLVSRHFLWSSSMKYTVLVVWCLSRLFFQKRFDPCNFLFPKHSIQRHMIPFHCFPREWLPQVIISFSFLFSSISWHYFLGSSADTLSPLYVPFHFRYHDDQQHLQVKRLPQGHHHHPIFSMELKLPRPIVTAFSTWITVSLHLIKGVKFNHQIILVFTPET